MPRGIINLAYLVASILFILGLKGLSHPRTAVRANMLGAAGMLIAIVATLLDKHILGFEVILAGLVVGTAIGAVLAARIQMTAMPEMVALLNGFGGAGSVLVAGAAFHEATGRGLHFGVQETVATVLSGLIGAVAFWGSMVAFAKLREMVSGNPLLLPARHVINMLLAVGTLALGGALVAQPTQTMWYWAVCLTSSALGILLVIPIGGADMPVVISLLNAYSGMAACATGFVLNNNMLVVTGSLVGASGAILTQIMCKAMNRSLANVLFGGLGSEVTSAAKADDVYAGKIRSTSAEEIAMLLEGAQRVVFVPGYGMAVAQAQHAVASLTRVLERTGAEVTFAIHPVAGRMPGHMNVLLAEADIPYEKLKDMDEINPSFATTDVAIVIGANDVVNPVARTDPKSPIAGMPILNVDQARTVVVIKRSLSPGFAGIPNPLFAAENTLMFFADGKEAVLQILSAVEEAIAA